jgi:hypothetical protein
MPALKLKPDPTEHEVWEFKITRGIGYEHGVDGDNTLLRSKFGKSPVTALLAAIPELVHKNEAAA